jgi:hypothetical protein
MIADFTEGRPLITGMLPSSQSMSFKASELARSNKQGEASLSSASLPKW